MGNTEDYSGVYLAEANALFQILEKILVIDVLIIWAYVAYRRCYVAFAKKDQGPLAQTRTALSALRRRRWTEGLFLALLVASATTASFYTTIVTNVVKPDKVLRDWRNYTMVHDIRKNDYTGPDLLPVLMRAAQVNVTRDDFYSGWMPLTPVEKMTLEPTFIPYNRAAIKEDSYGRQWSLGCHGNGSGCTAAVASNASLQNFWVQYFTSDKIDHAWLEKTELPNLQLVQHPYFSAATIGQDEMPGLKAAWLRDRNTTLIYDRYFSARGNRSILARETVKVVMYTATLHNGTSDLPDNTTCVAGGVSDLLYVKHGFWVKDGAMYESTAQAKCYSEGAVSKMRRINVDREIFMAGNHTRIPEEYDILREGYDQADYQDDLETSALRSRLVTGTDQRANDLRLLWYALIEGYTTGKEGGGGYRYRTLAFCTVPVAVLTLIAAVMSWLRLPFESNSLMENGYLNNHVDLDDCTSNKSAKSRPWWDAEAWASDDTWAAREGTRITVVINGYLLKATHRPDTLIRLEAPGDTSKMSLHGTSGP